MGGKQQLVSSVVLTTLDLVVRICGALLLSPLLIGALGTEATGVNRLLASCLAWLGLLDLGYAVAGARLAARAWGAGDAEKWWHVLGAAQRWYRRLAWVVLGLGAGLAGVVPVWIGDGRSWSAGTLVGLAILQTITLTARLATRSYGVALRSRMRYDLVMLPAIIRTVIQLIVLWGVIKLGHGSLWSVGLIMAGCEAGETCTMLILTRRVLGVTWNRLRSAAADPASAPVRPQLAAHARASFLTSFGSDLRSQVDPLMVHAVGGLRAVTLYTNGLQFVQIFDALIQSVLGGPVLSFLSQIAGAGDGERLHAVFRQLIRIGAVATVTLGGGLMLFGPAFVERWLGPEFSETGLVLWILIPAAMVRLMQAPGLNLLVGLGRPHIVGWITVGGGVFNVLASLGFAWGCHVGWMGVAWGTTLESLVLATCVVPWLCAPAGGLTVPAYGLLLIKPLAIMLIPVLAFAGLGGVFLQPDYRWLALGATVYGVGLSVWIWLVILSGVERAALLRKLGLSRK
jgi:O-antigen/teichoic acid export membrane protein